MAFYHGDEYIGETVEEAVKSLTYSECWNVAYDYLNKDFTHEDLVTFVLDLQFLPTIFQYAEEALYNLVNYYDDHPRMSYGDVKWKQNVSSGNRKPRTTTGKAPARKPANRRR